MKDGKAYAFFNCSADRGTIEAELPIVRGVIGSPRRLQLYFTDNVPDRHGYRYAMGASYRGAGNRATANEVAGVFNQNYNTALWKAGEPFEGEILFGEGKRFVSRN